MSISSKEEGQQMIGVQGVRFWGASIAVATIMLASLCLAPAAEASPGDVDRSFGDRGWVVSPPVSAGTHTLPEGMAIGLDDEILTLQLHWVCSGPKICAPRHLVQRYNADGSLDRAYGGTGIGADLVGILRETYPTRAAASIAVTRDGRAVVVIADLGVVTVHRLNARGAPDLTFGVGGKVRLRLDDEAQPQVAVQRNGKIIVAGTAEGRVRLVRLRRSGAPDPRFGSGAPPSERVGRGELAIRGSAVGALAISNPGPFALGGPVCCGESGVTKAYGARRAGDGRLLGRPRGKTGWRWVEVGDGASASSVVALPNGKIYLVGRTKEPRAAFAVKLRSDGRLERRYGHRGVARFRRLVGNAPVALVDDAARLVVAGRGDTDKEFVNEGLVVRRLPNGRLDRRWGRGAGSVSLLSGQRQPGWISDPVAVGIQSSGRIVVFGWQGTGCVRYCKPPHRSLVRLRGGLPKKRG